MKKLLSLLILALVIACKKEEAVALRASAPAPAPPSASASAPASAPAPVADADDSPGLSVPAGITSSPAATASEKRNSSSAEAPQPRVDRMIVRTADVKIIVTDTTAALQKITLAAENVGGYVSDSRLWRDGDLLNATLTIRVPANKLTPTLAQIRGVAKRVDSETISSSDVSQEYVDLGSRLRNLEAAETELRQLMTAVRERSKSASEVLEIHEQITMIRGQIEETRGRMRYLETVASLSSIHPV